MTLANTLFARLGTVLKRNPPPQQTDRFDARLKSLSAARTRQPRQSVSLFKNRPSHQAV